MGPPPDVSHPVMQSSAERFSKLNMSYPKSWGKKNTAIPTKATLSLLTGFERVSTTLAREGKNRCPSDDDYHELNQSFVNRMANTQVHFMILEELWPLSHLLPDYHASELYFPGKME
jgi:hypothetical protein